MHGRRVIILRGTSQKPEVFADTTILTLEEVKIASLLKHLLRYRQAQLWVYRLETNMKPLLSALLLRALSWGLCWIVDDQGNRQKITLGALLQSMGWYLQGLARQGRLLRQAQGEITALGLEYSALASTQPDWSQTPVYLRSDISFGLRAGGSLGHVAGVLNSIGKFTEKPPVFLTTDTISTVKRDIETHLIPLDPAFRDFPELLPLWHSEILVLHAGIALRGRKPSFIYQRYSVGNFSGVKLAKAYGVPLILEYNGSEVWVAQNWGIPLKHEKLCLDIEFLNLRAATLVVVVSQPIKDELIIRGIEANKILVNPNGVDPEKYSPDVDGSGVRSQHNLARKTIVGFIGTFGVWHGAEVLAEAFGLLLREFPTYRNRVRLLMIGDGPTMPQVKATVGAYGVADACILTGLVPQQEGPRYLAACDILVSPHVPNPDGTPFFGSPTKLFEYMAIGKGIVASKLEQIGEILEHDRTAWMIEAGNAGDLMLGLKTLIDDEPRRNRLGQAARAEVVAKYTWQKHTQKIIEKLKELCR